MIKIAAGFVLMISCTVAANVILKMGMTTPVVRRTIFGYFSVQSLVGIVLFGCALLVYTWLLQRVPLNIAQCFIASQFVAVILASALVLSESIPPLRWLGIVLITTGILLVGVTSRAGS